MIVGMASLPQGSKLLHTGGFECKNTLPMTLLVCKTIMDGS